LGSRILDTNHTPGAISPPDLIDMCARGGRRQRPLARFQQPERQCEGERLIGIHNDIGPRAPPIGHVAPNEVPTGVDRMRPGLTIDGYGCPSRRNDGQLSASPPERWDDATPEATQSDEQQRAYDRPPTPAVEDSRQQCVDVEAVGSKVHQCCPWNAESPSHRTSVKRPRTAQRASPAPA
jgi:hypothetical protein